MPFPCPSLTFDLSPGQEHLGYVHWVIANGMCLSVRSSLSEDHPLRRLLKQVRDAISRLPWPSMAFL